MFNRMPVWAKIDEGNTIIININNENAQEGLFICSSLRFIQLIYVASFIIIMIQ